MKILSSLSGTSIGVKTTGAKAMFYEGNYAANFGPRSIVDKGFVTGTTFLTANNGVLKTGNNFRLGGTITGDTTIKGGSSGIVFEKEGSLFFGPDSTSLLSGDYNFIGKRSWVNAAGSGSTAGIYQANNSANNHYVQVDNTGVDIYSQVATPAVKLKLHPTTGAIFTDTRTVKKGVEYAANYSSGFGPRSFPDVAFVTGTTFLSANNGLTKSGNNFRLGGSLTGNTSVLLGTRSLTFSGSSGGLTFTQHSGGIYLQDKGQGGLYMDSGTPSILGNVIDITSWEGDGNSTHRSRIRVSPTLIDLSSRSDLFFTSLNNFTVQNTGSGKIEMKTAGNILTAGASQGGWKYAANYSSGFTSRSIVDAAYVTGITSSLNTVNGAKVVATFSATTSSEFIGVSANTTMSVYLPISPKSYQRITVKDIKGNGLTVSTTVNGNGKLIDGSSTALINTNYGCIQLIYNTVGWSVVGFV